MPDVKRPSLVFASQYIGLPSEVWMWRQAVRFRRLSLRMLTWGYVNRETFPLEKIEVYELPFEFDRKTRSGRGYARIRGALVGNTWASFGAERRVLRSYFARVNPSVLLCQFGFVALRLVDVAKESGVPVVAHFHGRDVASMLRFRPYRRSLMKNLHRFDAIVVVGTHQERWMLEHGCEAERVHLIPCGATVDPSPPEVRTQGDTVRFLAVGRLAEMKGPQYTLQAFALVKRRVPRSSLKMVGDGPLRQDLERMAGELGIADSVCFTGPLSPEAVRHELIGCDVFVQHSLVVPSTGDCEGSPVALAEAAGAGLPVVSTLCPGITDQVLEGITGFLVPQRDVEGMAARMVRLAEDSGLRASLGAAGRQRVVTCFDVNEQVRKLEDVLIHTATGQRTSAVSMPTARR